MVVCGTYVARTPQDGPQTIRMPLLGWADSAHQIAKPSGVDCADLLN
jgi:hypothetical protein